MFGNDIIYILSFWSTWWLLGLISLPVSVWWFGNLWDRGYGVARVIGILVVSYVAWLGASLQMWKFGYELLLVWLAVWLGINVYVGWRYKDGLLKALKERGWLWLRLEIVFVATLVIWSLIRGFQPDIHGLEKFMDYGFVNSILRSDYFPPADMWFAGSSINYYYFGHYWSAVVILLSGLSASVGYNLMIASIAALGMLLGVSLGGNVISWLRDAQDKEIQFSRRWIGVGGLLTGFLIMLRGNLHWGAYQLNRLLNGCLGQTNGVPNTCQTSFEWLPDATKGYWYPDATRYITFTIHEFPIYSIVVADLHAHLINLPVVLVYLTVLLRSVVREKFDYVDMVIFGWMLGVFYMTNAWDVPIYLMVLGVSMLLWWIRKYEISWSLIGGTAGLVALVGLTLGTMTWIATSGAQVGGQLLIVGGLIVISLVGFGGYWLVNNTKDRMQLWEIVKGMVPRLLLVIGLIVSVSMPFSAHFEQIGQGILPVHARSALVDLLVLWGWNLFLCLTLIGIVVWWWKFAKKPQRISWQDTWILGLFFVGWFLIILPEFIYLKDIYIDDYHRANTMFKLVYQSWILFAIGGGYTIVRLATLPQKYAGMAMTIGKYGLLTVVVLGLWTIGKYPSLAIQSYYGIWDAQGRINIQKYKGLDGTTWLAEKSPDEQAVLDWLMQLERQPVILEAVGDSYTEFNRFSAYSGLPTVEGWRVHEWLWRGGYDEPGRRSAEVEHIYTAATLDETKSQYEADPLPSPRNLLKHYGVQYIIVGDMERDEYPELNEKKFAEIGEVVFESGESRVWKISF